MAITITDWSSHDTHPNIWPSPTPAGRSCDIRPHSLRLFTKAFPMTRDKASWNPKLGITGHVEVSGKMRDPQSSPWVSILSHGHRRLDDLVPKWSTFDTIRYSLSWLYNNTFHIIVPICTNHYRLTNNNSTLYPYYNNRYQNISNALQDIKLLLHQKKTAVAVKSSKWIPVFADLTSDLKVLRYLRTNTHQNKKAWLKRGERPYTVYIYISRTII